MTQRRRIELSTPRGMVIVEGPVLAEEIARSQMDPGLKSFRPPERQKAALIGITDASEGRIIIAHVDDTIIGYVTFHLPEEFSRWSQGQVPNLIEMGAIEVSEPWRQYKVGRALMDVGYNREEMENYIIIATEYYWHWDLKAAGLDVFAYQKMLEKFFNSYGLRRVGTDEPDILGHPANMLMARIGKGITPDNAFLFESSLHQNRWMI